MERFAAQGVEIIRHSARKDYTDLELALMLAGERGADSIVVLGSWENVGI